jgi:hypothetical protein
MMQGLDSCSELPRQRHSGFEDHPGSRIRRKRRPAVEPEPGDRIDKLSLTVDEVRDPERILAQVDRHFAPVAATQELALNRSCESVPWVQVQAGLIAAPAGYD